MTPHLPPEVLSAVVDGELSAYEFRTADSHLQSCPDCARALREVRAVRDAVAALPRLSAPPELVLAISRPPGAVRQLVRGPRRWAVAAAAAAVVISLAGLAVPPDGAEEPPVDVFVARHVSATTGYGGEVLFAVTGR